MASPYTKDITKSSAFKQVTGQDQDKFDQFLQGAVQVKKAYNNQVTNNIDALREDKVLEIQKKKLLLKGLNGVSTIQKDIEQNFNNNVDAWARNYAQKELKNEALSKYGIEETTANQVDLVHPDAAYGDWINKRAQGIADNYNNLVNELDSVGLPYRDIEEGKTFIDNAYQAAFNGLERDNRFNILNSVGSLFRGHGLGNKSASELKADFDRNIANSSLSEIESINNTFKALYGANPALAKDYEDVIRKADIRQGVETSSSEVKEEERFDRTTGRTYKVRYQEVYHSYKDKLGRPQTFVSIEPVKGTGAKIDITPAQTINAINTYLQLLEQDGHEAFLGLLKDVEPYQAFMKIRGQFGKSLTQLEAEALRQKLAPEIMSNWNVIQESYMVTNPATGAQDFRADIKAYREDPNKVAKPTGYYHNINEYAKDIMGFALDVEPMNPNYRFPDRKTYTVDEGLSTSSAWKNFATDENLIRGIRDDLDLSIEFEQDLLRDFEAGIYDNVDKYGNYFPMQNEQLLLQTVEQTKRKLYIAPEVLDQLGLDSLEFDGGAKIGYNVVSKKLVLQPFSNQSLLTTGTQEKQVEPTRAEGGFFTRTLQSINDIPVLGAVTEEIFGDKFGDNFTDYLVFIPIGGLGVMGFRLGTQLTKSALKKTYEKLGKKMLQKGYDPFKEGAKYGTVSQSGRSVELQSIGRDLIKSNAIDPIKKGTAIIVGKDTKGRLYRLGGAASVPVIETYTTPDPEE
tara:strand:- start:5792 stop:8011 length:2220 start_codon:yes stop_codon:yes gene_type:complete